MRETTHKGKGQGCRCVRDELNRLRQTIGRLHQRINEHKPVDHEARQRIEQLRAATHDLVRDFAVDFEKRLLTLEGDFKGAAEVGRWGRVAADAGRQGSTDPRQAATLSEVLELLKRHGVDVSHIVTPKAQATPQEATGRPVDPDTVKPTIGGVEPWCDECKGFVKPSTVTNGGLFHNVFQTVNGLKCWVASHECTPRRRIGLHFNEGVPLDKVNEAAPTPSYRMGGDWYCAECRCLIAPEQVGPVGCGPSKFYHYPHGPRIGDRPLSELHEVTNDPRKFHWNNEPPTSAPVPVVTKSGRTVETKAQQIALQRPILEKFFKQLGIGIPEQHLDKLTERFLKIADEGGFGA